MPLHAIAIDDDNIFLTILEKLTSKIPCIDLKHKFNNALDGMLYLKKHKPDLVFLDINMPDISGLEIASQIDESIMIIFTTGHKDYAVDAFNLNAIDYLVKPFEFDRFYKAVCKAEECKKVKIAEPEKNEPEEDSLVIKAEYKNYKVQKSDILFIEAMDSYVKIHTHDQTYITLQNLKSMEELLNQDQFMRIHKSFIVSLNKIEHFSRNQVFVNGNPIPLGRTYLPAFRETIN